MLLTLVLWRHTARLQHEKSLDMIRTESDLDLLPSICQLCVARRLPPVQLPMEGAPDRRNNSLHQRSDLHT